MIFAWLIPVAEPKAWPKPELEMACLVYGYLLFTVYHLCILNIEVTPLEKVRLHGQTCSHRRYPMSVQVSRLRFWCFRDSRGSGFRGRSLRIGVGRLRVYFKAVQCVSFQQSS